MKHMKAQGFIFIGRIACLDFIDTAALGSPARTEALRDFGDLLTWLYEEGSVLEVQQNRAQAKSHGMRVMRKVTESFGEDAHHDREKA